VSTISTPELNQ